MTAESPLWYDRFLAYRNLGPRRRLADCAPRGIVPPSWYDAADRYRWRERAQAYDAEQAEGTRAADRRERVGLLKATRGKLITALQATEATSDTFSQLTRDIATITDQLRKEQED